MGAGILAATGPAGPKIKHEQTTIDTHTSQRFYGRPQKERTLTDMPNKSPAFQFYVKDWSADEHVRTMNAEQRGWYIQYLADAWHGDPPCTLPDDDNHLKELARFQPTTLVLTDLDLKGISTKIADALCSTVDGLMGPAYQLLSDELLSGKVASLLHSVLANAKQLLRSECFDLLEQERNAFMVRVEADREARWTAVKKRFKKKGDRLVHERLLQEWTKQQENRRKRAISGHLGGIAKSKSLKRNSYMRDIDPVADESSVKQMLAESQENAQQLSHSNREADPKQTLSSSISIPITIADKKNPLSPPFLTEHEKKYGSRCRPDFTPNAETVEWAELFYSDVNVEEELTYFLNHWISKPGRGAYRLDWDLTFRNWLGRRQRDIDERNPLKAIKELERRDAQERARQERHSEAAESQESDNTAGLFDVLTDYS